jgi:hypothetical protein
LILKDIVFDESLIIKGFELCRNGVASGRLKLTAKGCLVTMAVISDVFIVRVSFLSSISKSTILSGLRITEYDRSSIVSVFDLK